MGYALRSIFVPVGDKANKLLEIKKYYEDEYEGNIQYNEGRAFAAVGADNDSDFDHYDLSEDSRVFGEAIGIQVTTYGDDCLMYDHWINGECARSLHFDPYEGWVRVEGKGEAWENESLFKAGGLEQDLLMLEQNAKIKEKDERMAQLRHLIGVRHLIQGYYYPVISGEGVLSDVVRYFNLTSPKI